MNTHDAGHDAGPSPKEGNDPVQPVATLDEVRAAHNIVAAVAGLDAARQAILALERAGIPGNAISLLGAYRSNPNDVPAPAVDEGPGGDVAAGTAKGAAAGAVGAGAVGALGGLLIPGIGPVVAGGLWSLAGAAAGGTIGGVSETAHSEAWRHTYQVISEGNFAVGVHSDDIKTVMDAHKILEGTNPLSINRFEG